MIIVVGLLDLELQNELTCIDINFVGLRNAINYTTVQIFYRIFQTPLST